MGFDSFSDWNNTVGQFWCITRLTADTAVVYFICWYSNNGKMILAEWLVLKFSNEGVLYV